MNLIAMVIHRAIQIFTLIVIIYTILTYFLTPFHPIREGLARFIEPLLTPIRRLLPQTAMLDFSPLVLIILLQIIDYIVVRLIG